MPLDPAKRGAIHYLRGTIAAQRVYENRRLGARRAAKAFRVCREATVNNVLPLEKPPRATSPKQP